MNRHFIILVSLICLLSCNSSKDEISNFENDLDRIELSLAANTEEKYIDIDIDFRMNPGKWVTTYIKADYLKTHTDSILKIIHSDEFIKPIIQDIIKSLEDKINLLGLHDERYLLARNQRFGYWRTNNYNESQKYSLAIDLRLCISDILDELVDQVKESSVSFNTLKPVILESSNLISVGETYVAKIGIQAYDSTSIPSVRIGDIELEVIGGFGIYRATSNIPGEKTFEGDIRIVHNGTVISQPFKETYVVK